MSKIIYTEKEILDALNSAIDATHRNDEDLWELGDLMTSADSALSNLESSSTNLCYLTEEDRGIYDGICDEDCWDEYIMYTRYTHDIYVYDEITDKIEEKTINIKVYYGNNTLLGDSVDVYID